MKGIYLLLLHLESPLDNLEVGRLGRFCFAAGYYLYIGSAFGAGGIPARLAYHRQAIKARSHWHIDYLRPYTQIIETWSAACSVSRECAWVRALADLPHLSVPVPRFGARDNGCASHLLYATHRPGVRPLTTALLAALAQESAQSDLTLEITTYEDNSARSR